MDSRLAKILMIILAVIIVVVSVLGTILYCFTDLLKSKDVLFKKYTFQNITDIADILDITTEESLIEKTKNNDYEESGNASLKYLENSSDKEEEYIFTEEGVDKQSTNESYRSLSIDYNDENLIKIENLNQEDKYGIRLANLVKQFACVENLNLPYFISSIGGDGEYFSDKLENIDWSGAFDFTDDEISQLKKTYMNTIFSDIESGKYSSKSNTMITLNNGKSITTKAYSFTFSQNDLNKIYKRFFTQAAKDTIILSKLENIDNKIKEMGIIEKDDKTIKSMYVDKLTKLANDIQYSGTDDRQITVTAYQRRRNTRRIEIKSDTYRILLDFDSTEGNEISLKTIKSTDQGEDEKLYTISKNVSDDSKVTRDFSYQDDSTKLSAEFNMSEETNGISSNINLEYSNKKITSLKLNGSLKQEFTNNAIMPTTYNDEKSILLNDYEGEKIISLVGSLKQKEITKLQEVQSKINTKMLNNILNWVEEKVQKKAEKEKNAEEEQKVGFNNKFELYKGEDLEYEQIQSLLKAIESNFTDYKVEDNKIKISVKEGDTNSEKFEKLTAAITQKETYNVELKYADDGYINEIDISVYKKK